jgi:hypothetical protein
MERRTMTEFLHGYRTYIVAAIIAVLGVLEQTNWFTLWDDPKAGWTAVGSAVVMAVLRSVTTTPPGPLRPPAADEPIVPPLTDEDVP